MSERIENQTAAQETEALLMNIFSDRRGQKAIKGIFGELDHDSKILAFLLVELFLHDFSCLVGIEIYRQLRSDVKKGFAA